MAERPRGPRHRERRGLPSETLGGQTPDKITQEDAESTSTRLRRRPAREPPEPTASMGIRPDGQRDDHDGDHVERKRMCRRRVPRTDRDPARGRVRLPGGRLRRVAPSPGERRRTSVVTSRGETPETREAERHQSGRHDAIEQWCSGCVADTSGRHECDDPAADERPERPESRHGRIDDHRPRPRALPRPRRRADRPGEPRPDHRRQPRHAEERGGANPLATILGLDRDRQKPGDDTETDQHRL